MVVKPKWLMKEDNYIRSWIPFKNLLELVKLSSINVSFGPGSVLIIDTKKEPVILIKMKLERPLVAPPATVHTE